MLKFILKQRKEISIPGHDNVATDLHSNKKGSKVDTP